VNLSIEWDKEEVSPMRLLLISIFIAAGLTLGGVSSFANDTKTKTNTHEITLMGQINDIEGDSLVVKDSRGTIHIVIPAAPFQLERVRVGDSVTVKLGNNGKAVVISKSGKTIGNSEANVQATLSGKITNIKGDSLWVQDSVGKTHRVIPAAPLQLERVRVGDSVIIGMRNGRAAVVYNIKNMGGPESM
jgi:antitoxin component of MazEF toxin-antitoxin module